MTPYAYKAFLKLKTNIKTPKPSNHNVKEPSEMSMAWEPERSSNFFSPPAHICAVTYIIEISLIVTLSNERILTHSLHNTMVVDQ